jgi:acyl-CoA synthetase (AMP-forming)/AMP-acid ligase II/acyl carrier protein
MSFTDLSIRKLLRTVADKDPARPAILAPGRLALSYARLLELADHTRNQLRGFGIGPQDRLAMVLPTSPETAAAFLTVSDCAVSAPMNPALNRRELTFHLSDLHARAVIVWPGESKEARAAAADLHLPTLELRPSLDAEAGWFELAPGDGWTAFKANGETILDTPETSLLLHTSGSTARPKLVPLSARALCFSSACTARSLALTSSDRCLNMLPLFHVHGLVSGLLVPLASGSSIVLTSGFVPERFRSWLEEFQPTWYSASPVMHQVILEQLDSSGPLDKSGLRFVRSGSASLSRTTMERLESGLGVPMIEAYGMTEVPHISGNPLHRRKLASVGVSVAPELAILDESGKIQPPGKTGEVVVRGPTVTRGYENNAEANGVAFEGGWFRTGDQGWMDEEGYLFLTGRLKEMINRGGEKVSPYEVEAALLEHSAIAKAAVFSIPDPRWGEEVGAAVVLKDSQAATEEQLRHFVRERLAMYKVPRRIVKLPALPVGPTGKTMRIGLAAQLNLGETSCVKSHAAPKAMPTNQATETTLCQLWADVLEISDVTAEDNFFDRGGHSLLALRLLSRINRLFEIELPLRVLFEAPTLRELARAIDQAKNEGQAQTAPAITRISRTPLNGRSHPDPSSAGHLNGGKAER